MARRKAKATDQEEVPQRGESRWDIVPLPPNEFKKATVWSRTPEVVPCGNRNCRHGRTEDGQHTRDICDIERVLCDGCFRELVVEVQARAAMNPKLREAVGKIDAGRSGGGNGNGKSVHQPVGT